MMRMKKKWISPKVDNIGVKNTFTRNESICTNSICISRCEVCGGCTGSKTKVFNCSYYEKLQVKICSNIEGGGCNLPLS